jgi:hypothetical protein
MMAEEVTGDWAIVDKIYLNRLREDARKYDQAYKENAELKAKVQRLNKQVGSYFLNNTVSIPREALADLEQQAEELILEKANCKRTYSQLTEARVLVQKHRMDASNLRIQLVKLNKQLEAVRDAAKPTEGAEYFGYAAGGPVPAAHIGARVCTPTNPFEGV